ncbi:hypothetical protein RHSIM_Rhsim05G0206000 [Rhododendron simsii]|uniref:Uncharacterized protein n=1 Tax=Rhododendron simsii TaxID=118357 RepID=A0A834H9U8_RHOSS|nr:hypothetical protein RHSIM_Rhsim05G0206000 [Rhododendron simsii]
MGYSPCLSSLPNTLHFKTTTHCIHGPNPSPLTFMSSPQNPSSTSSHLPFKSIAHFKINHRITPTRHRPPPNPKFLVRAFIKPSSKASSADTKLIVISSVITMTLAIANRVLYKLALVPMKEYPFFLAQVTTFGYVAIYFTILYVRYRAGIVTDAMMAIPKSPFVMIGILEALGVAAGMSSGAMLPGPAIPILNQTFLVWQLAFSTLLLGTKYSRSKIGGCLLVAAGVVVAVARYFNLSVTNILRKNMNRRSTAAGGSVALVSHDGENSSHHSSVEPLVKALFDVDLRYSGVPFVVYNYSGSDAGQMLSGIGFLWPVLMIASSAFQAGASILKESVFIDAATRLKGKVLDIFVVNSFGSGFQALFVLLFLPFLSNLRGIPFSQLPSYIKSGAGCFFNMGAHTIGNLSYIWKKADNVLRWSSAIAHPLYREQHSIQHISAPSSKDFLCSPFFYCCNSCVTFFLSDWGCFSYFAVPIAIYILSLPLPYLPEATTLSSFFVFGSMILLAGLVVYNIPQPLKQDSEN